MLLSQLFENVLSNAQLISIARSVGNKMFGKSSSGFVFVPKVNRLTKSEFLDRDDSGTIGTFEFVFFPSKKTGIDVADSELKPSYADIDGNIYIAGAAGVFVIQTSSTKSKQNDIEVEQSYERFKNVLAEKLPNAVIVAPDKRKLVFAYLDDKMNKMVGQFNPSKDFSENGKGKPCWLVIDSEYVTLGEENWEM